MADAMADAPGEAAAGPGRADPVEAAPLVEEEAAPRGGGIPAWRVKVYRLSELGTWDDQGTGYARVEHLAVRKLLSRSSRHCGQSLTMQSFRVFRTRTRSH
jgi:hypothetical protein